MKNARIPPHNIPEYITENPKINPSVRINALLSYRSFSQMISEKRNLEELRGTLLASKKLSGIYKL